MPFLDHLEELRWRSLWSGIAIIVGSVIGFCFELPCKSDFAKSYVQ